jgi:hypothetical protein
MTGVNIMSGICVPLNTRYIYRFHFYSQHHTSFYLSSPFPCRLYCYDTVEPVRYSVYYPYVLVGMHNIWKEVYGPQLVRSRTIHCGVIKNTAYIPRYKNYVLQKRWCERTNSSLQFDWINEHYNYHYHYKLDIWNRFYFSTTFHLSYCFDYLDNFCFNFGRQWYRHI